MHTTAKQSHIMITAITTSKLEFILYQTNNTNIRNSLVCQVIDYLEAYKNKLCLLALSHHHCYCVNNIVHGHI